MLRYDHINLFHRILYVGSNVLQLQVMGSLLVPVLQCMLQKGERYFMRYNKIDVTNNVSHAQMRNETAILELESRNHD